MKLRFSREADADIGLIYFDSAISFGIRQADAYREGLLGSLRFISEHPYSVPERRNLKRPVRVHPYEAHLIAYLIDDEGVFVVRVVHGHRNLMDLL
ncbi:MAG TPA: type II toxin-antitoxin system RelE/ParE family toxin [Devosia sp.]|nr:type II toxin-antitoxin system RelE/ParE family toxin [Devosia sp.]